MSNPYFAFSGFLMTLLIFASPKAYSQQDSLMAAKWSAAAKRAKDSAKYELAINYYQKSLESYDCALLLDKDSSLLIKQGEAYLELAKVYQIQSMYDAAMEIGEKVLETSEKNFGVDHPLLAKAYNLLGTCLDEKGELDKALAYHRKALKIRIAYFGELHSEVSHSVNNFGNIALSKGEYAQAIAYFQKSLYIRTNISTPNPRDIASSHVNLGIAHTQMSEYDSAFFHFEEAERLFLKVLPEKHHILSYLYNNIAIVYQEVGAFEQALDYNFLSLKIKEEIFPDNYPLLGRSYLNLGSVYLMKGELFEAEKYLQQGLDLFLKSPGQNPGLIGALYHNLSAVIKIIGDRTLAEEYQLKALEMEKKVYGEIHPEIAKQYNNLALLYQEKGDLSEARNFLLKALDIQLKTLSASHPEVGQSYGNLGVIEESLENYGAAADYMDKAWFIFRSLFQENHPRISDMYLNRGIIALKRGKEKQAKSWINKSLQLRKKYFGERHVSVAQSYFNLAKIFADKGEFANAIPYYQVVLEIYEEVYGEVHPLMALTHLQLGLIAHKQEHWEEAIEIFDKALFALGIEERDFANFQINGILSEMYALEILYHRAFSQFKLADQEKKQIYACDRSLSYAHELIEFLRKSFQHEETELHLQNFGLPMFELALRCKLRLYEESGEEKYLEQAFHYMERSKAYLLQRALSIDESREFMALPEEVLSKERELKLKYAYHLHELQNTLIQEEDSLSQELLERSLTVKQAHDSLQKVLSNEYPDYYQLKYASPTTSLKELQSRLSDYSGKVMLEYFWGDSYCIVFAISPEKIHYRSFALDSSLLLNLREFIELNTNVSYVQNEKKFLEGKQKFKKLGGELYKSLLDSSLHEFSDVKSLLIIPDGLLGYLAFEVLLTEDTEESSYKSFPYLLRKYSISYEYSASTLLKAINGKTSSEYAYAGFAPTYTEAKHSLPSSMQRVGGMKPEFPITKLAFNQEEVEEVADLLQGTSILGEAATESRFKKEAADYDILHLAMHAFLNDEHALESGLLFTNGRDSLEDGILYAYELYNMDLKAQLVVLSACHTAGGELARGEGILSLSRAFKFAGCPNILASYWQADDRSTKVLMKDFFKQIKSSSSAAETLQEIKLAYLKQVSEVQAHPSNWAAWALIGDPQALIMEDTNSSKILLLFLLILISVFFFWLYKT